ncbi:MAG: F0F1 ATP synthase subunit B' [Rhodospirillales bacterium]|nr:F0F1 ATP synthase subunit B' [Rhodospirillales bacterium]
MPQFDMSTAPSQIFWLLVVFGLLYLTFVKVVLPKVGGVIEMRSNKIEGDLARAQSLKDEAEEAVAAYEKALAAARAEASQILHEAAGATRQQLEAETATFEKDLNEKVQAAQARIAAAEAEARSYLQEIAVAAAGLTTEKLIGLVPSEADAKAAVERATAGAAS